MRLLTDTEIAERICDMLPGLEPGETFTTESLVKRVPVYAEELLPVGDLSGVHFRLMELLDASGVFRPEFAAAPALMPYRRPYRIVAG